MSVRVATQAGPGNISNTIAVCGQCDWRQVFRYRTEAQAAADEHDTQAHKVAP